jgi:lycopene beta-cyclase
MVKYDYIILGAGASGLMLAYRMATDPFFGDKTILIIDKAKSKGNDRTWCFWEQGLGEWDNLLAKTWQKIYFGSKSYSKEIEILPYQYKMITSENFYNSLWVVIHKKANITFRQDTVINVIEHKHKVEVVTNNGVYFGSKLFNSLYKSKLCNSQNKYPVLQQHFVGWFVKTKESVFDDSVATFMDFTVPQKGNTRFMYMLPLDKTTALFEYTLFSEELLELEDYENAIVDYLKQKNISDFDIIEKEKGVIPMTSFKFSQLNSKHILNIGTAGGWTKASTGYTFRNITKKTRYLIEFLKYKKDLSQFHKKSKFWFYDLIFLDVLANYNNEGAALFSSMFNKADIKTIFKFLDEESTLYEDLKIILSVPPKRFIQSFFKRLF